MLEIKEGNPFGYTHKVNYMQQTGEVKWAHSGPWFGLSDHPHWSRKFEYPWVIASIRDQFYKTNSTILDAAGGKGELAIQLANLGSHVTVVDLDISTQFDNPRLKYEKGDISKLSYKDNTFDYITCISVLEHTSNPYQILDELWRILKPGGKLLVSLDVASNRRYNHSIDEGDADKILQRMGLRMPFEMPGGLLINEFPEIEPKEWEHLNVILRVLCFWRVKTK